MKTITLLVFAVLLALAVNRQSVGEGIIPKSPLDKLKELKAKNAEIIDKQAATLQKLDELDKQAEQMRFFSKRS